MSQVRAEWHTPDLGLARDDPFAPPAAVGRIEEIGTPIDLDGDTAKLNERLMGTIRRENRLVERGVECAIKNRADTSCHACPVSHHQATDELGTLCRIGREQEEVLTMLAVINCSPSP